MYQKKSLPTALDLRVADGGVNTRANEDVMTTSLLDTRGRVRRCAQLRLPTKFRTRLGRTALASACDSETVMTTHVLLKHAVRRPYCTAPAMPKGARYDPAKGYWITDDAPLVLSTEFGPGGGMTKKCDQETGEDMKGE